MGGILELQLYEDGMNVSIPQTTCLWATLGHTKNRQGVSLGSRVVFNRFIYQFLVYILGEIS